MGDQGDVIWSDSSHIDLSKEIGCTPKRLHKIVWTVNYVDSCTALMQMTWTPTIRTSDMSSADSKRWACPSINPKVFWKEPHSPSLF